MTQLTKNFHSSEFGVDDETPSNILRNILDLSEALQVIRDFIDCPIKINSAYRTPEHNKKIGGSPNSQHLKGKAVDLKPLNATPGEMLLVIQGLINIKAIPEGGIGVYDTFIHYDIRGTKARWKG